MALETATYINQLVAANPTHADGVNQGDAHLRLIKSVLQSTFPNVSNAVTFTAGNINGIVNSLLPGGALNLQGTGGNSVNGSVPVGSLHSFPADPGRTLCAISGSGTGNEQFLRCDGSTYASSLYPNLAASPFVTVAGSNFTVPQLMDTGRFLRSYTFGGATLPGQSQANQNQSHTHTINVSDPGHAHSITDPGHVHAITDPGHYHQFPISNSVGNGSAITISNVNSSTFNTQTATTGISINSHTTGITGANSNTTGITATAASVGGGEARPEAYVVFMCIKT